MVTVRDTFCSYGVMELCSKGLGTSTSALRAKGINLSCVRTLCVIAEERPRINLTTNFAKLFSALNLTPRAVSTSFGCRVNVGICLQVHSYCFVCNNGPLRIAFAIMIAVFTPECCRTDFSDITGNSVVCSRPLQELPNAILLYALYKMPFPQLNERFI